MNRLLKFASLALILTTGATTSKPATALPYKDSANIEFWDKAFLAFDNGNCTNVNIYQDHLGNKLLIGAPYYLNRCNRAIGAGQPRPQSLATFARYYGPTAAYEVKQMESEVYTKGQPLHYTYYLGYVKARWEY